MSQLIGHISQVIGPVVDVYFEGKNIDQALLLPSIHDALTIKRDDGRTLIVEVQQHIGEDTVRTVAMDSTDGLRRGMEVIPTGHPITMPVGDQIKGRLMNVVGDAVDGMKELDKEGACKMILLTLEEVIALHKKLIDRTGGSHGLRDKSLLESALYSAVSCFDGVEAYPTAEEKAARYMFALTNNHAFVDGNKRIGIFIMLMTLDLNGVTLSYTQTELITLGLSVADGSMSYGEILSWILAHKV